MLPRDLGYEDKKFELLGGHVDNFVSLGDFSGYNAPLTHIVYT